MECIKFKEWLLKEDPEEPLIKTIDKKHYAGEKEIEYPVNWRSHDALSFGILKNFYIYADSSMGLYHKDLIDHLWKMIKYPNKKIYTMDDNLLADDISVSGTLNDSALLQIKDWIKVVEKDFLKKDRIAALHHAPDFILGRIWTEQKVISFWNREWSVYKQSEDVIKFISLFGNPHDYMFEIENEWRDYGDFIKKTKKEQNIGFDQSKLHVLDPSIKGQVLQSFGIKPQSPQKPGIRTWQSAFTSESATLYHGTKGQFKDLKPNKARFGTGISFTTNPDIALNYALGKYKGGQTTGRPNVKKIEYSGRSFNFFEKVPVEIISKMESQLSPYLGEFTSDKKRIFLKSLYGAWAKDGKTFYKEIQKSFAKKGTNEECKLAKSRNKDLEVCSACSTFKEMPDLLNKILNKLGFDSLCYEDINDGISHKCYFLIKQADEI